MSLGAIRTASKPEPKIQVIESVPKLDFGDARSAMQSTKVAVETFSKFLNSTKGLANSMSGCVNWNKFPPVSAASSYKRKVKRMTKKYRSLNG